MDLVHYRGRFRVPGVHRRCRRGCEADGCTAVEPAAAVAAAGGGGSGGGGGAGGEGI